MAATTAEAMSDSVLATTRAVKVEAVDPLERHVRTLGQVVEQVSHEVVFAGPHGPQENQASRNPHGITISRIYQKTQ